jgi:hypothetical protein
LATSAGTTPAATLASDYSLLIAPLSIEHTE